MFLLKSWTRSWRRWRCSSRTHRRKPPTSSRTIIQMLTTSWAYATSRTAKVRKWMFPQTLSSWHVDPPWPLPEFSTSTNTTSRSAKRPLLVVLLNNTQGKDALMAGVVKRDAVWHRVWLGTFCVCGRQTPRRALHEMKIYFIRALKRPPPVPS